VEKAKAAAASGSAATMVAGQAAVDSIETLMDQARQTKSVLGQSAAKIKEATQWQGGWPGWSPVLTEPPVDKNGLGIFFCILVSRVT
jgi:hypothetical protein